MAKRKKKRRSWTSSEVRELKTMARKKTSASQIAKKLKRTEGATRQKAFSIGLSLELPFLIFSSTSALYALRGAGLWISGVGAPARGYLFGDARPVLCRWH